MMAAKGLVQAITLGVAALISFGVHAQPAANIECNLASGDENLLAIKDGDKQINIGYRQAELEADTDGGSTVANILTLGIASEKLKQVAWIPGTTSRNRIKSRRPVFPDLTHPTGQTPEDAFALVRLSLKGDKRAIQVGEASGNIFSYSERSQIPPQMLVKLDLKTLQSGCRIGSNGRFVVYEGTPSADLTPGEYAVMYGTSFYDFTIE
jgi:hypothetical protein